MSLELSWMRPEAPYMPIAAAGLLLAMADADLPATAHWRSSGVGTSFRLETDASIEQVSRAVADAPWPDLTKIAWPDKPGQAIKPVLAQTDDPVATLAKLRRHAEDHGLVAESRLLTTLVTDAVLDGSGVPSRSRLLRGVKSDLSGVADKVSLTASEIARELADGPQWRNKGSGRGLGFVPEVQTFGGTTGRQPSGVGAHSALLYRLLWLGIMALPPVAVVVRGRRTVGGPLVTALHGNDVTLSWPVWTFPATLDDLRALYMLPQVHAEFPNARDLVARGIVDVFRATSSPINSMLGTFRWGERVMGR